MIGLATDVRKVHRLGYECDQDMIRLDKPLTGAPIVADIVT